MDKAPEDWGLYSYCSGRIEFLKLEWYNPANKKDRRFQKWKQKR